jgi:Flp pilus assembly pilin Flp
MGKIMMRFWRDQRGIGTLEIIIIIAVLVLVAFAFREWIIDWVTGLFNETDATIDQIQSNNRPAGLFPTQP